MFVYYTDTHSAAVAVVYTSFSSFLLFIIYFLTYCKDDDREGKKKNIVHPLCTCVSLQLT